MKREPTRLRLTGLWFLFGPVLGCMWLAAVNYSNNLVYGVLYLIAALSFVSVFHAWRNIASVEVEHVRVKPAFAGEEIEVEIHLRNRARRANYNLVFERYDRTAKRRKISLPIRGSSGVNVEGNDAQTVTVVLPPSRRGEFRFENLVVRSSYPFGLFWALFRVAVKTGYFVYPAPKGSEDLPELQPSGQEGPPVNSRSGDDFSGVRAYAPGESLRHIDWKAYARGRPLVVKQFSGGQERELWLGGRKLALPLEDRLSQLALWATEAEEAQIPYGLQLGEVKLSPQLGAAHQRRVLEALAVADRT